MNCQDIRYKIDMLLEDQDIRLDEKIIQHAASCPECARYLESTRMTMRMIDLQSRVEPVLKDPEGLTDEIMQLITDKQQAGAGSGKSKNNNTRLLQVVQRLLAAASVCLLMVFSYEEFVVVNKISSLEKQNSARSSSTSFSTGKNLEKAGMLFSSGVALPAYLEGLKSGNPKLFTLLKAASYLDETGFSPEKIFPGGKSVHMDQQFSLSFFKNHYTSKQNNSAR